MTEENNEQYMLEVIDLKNRFKNQWVHKGLNFKVKKGEIVAIIGASGCGKTTLLRSILMLRKPTSGTIKVFGTDVTTCTRRQALDIQHRWGVMYQNLALFSSLRVWENIIFPVQRYHMLKSANQKQLAFLKIAMVGLRQDSAAKYPSEISGGMAKRVALARAIVQDPELVFLDEHSSGLDPIATRLLDALILELRETLGITFVMIIHDIETLRRVPDRILFLGKGEILGFGSLDELRENPNPVIQEYFAGETADCTDKFIDEN